MNDNENSKDESTEFEDDQLDRILKQELDTAFRSFKKRLDNVKNEENPLSHRKRRP